MTQGTIFYAHSTARSDRSDWELLQDHLQAVAKNAERFGQPLGIGPAVRTAGLLHDIGKFDTKFQARLMGSTEKVDHSTAGARTVVNLAKTYDEKLVAALVAHAIAGHHAGLPDSRSSGDTSLEARIGSFDVGVLDRAHCSILPETLAGLFPSFAWDMSSAPALGGQLAMLGRMIFSCLVDADFKETERFYETVGERKKDRDWQTLVECLPVFLQGFDARIAGFGAPENDLARHRTNILGTVRKRAAMAPGLFTLNVPTGGGKTLASLGFALDHAAIHGHRRIIFSIPFTSIIDQTAAIFRDVLGAEHVLEHHSAIEDEAPRRGAAAGKADSERSSKDKMRLAMEDWAAPVVVTTHVQLFESLFAARPSRARKLHNIAGSVVILDEAQVLPRHLLAPTVRAIDELAKNWGCTIVLCTATQPAFDARNLAEGHPLALALEGRELAPDPVRMHAAFRRNRLVHVGEMDDDALVAALGDAPQALVIVNSRAHALELYRAAQAAGFGGLLHLTTRQCAAHRRKILKDVRARLESPQIGGRAPCRLVATSLIEAGVDVDFPVAWRAEAGLDQIAQAAGRVNREMLRSADASTVTVFKAKGRNSPAEIVGLVGDMQRMMDRHSDLFSPAAMEEYFGETYWRLDVKGLDREDILGKMHFSSGQGLDVSYRTIAGKYRMVESGMVPVVVPYDDAARAAVDKLGLADIPSSVLARDLQLYVVQVPPRARRLLLVNGHVAFAAPKVRGDQFAVLKTPSLYDDAVGLVWENADYMTIEGGIV